MLFVLIVAAAMAILTWVVGWWGIVVAAAITGVVFREQGGGGWRVALAAALSWTALLLVDVVGGPFAHLARVLAGVMRVPAPALIAITLLFAATLAWSAATVAAVLGDRSLTRRAAVG
jgi:hypothetical protein